VLSAIGCATDYWLASRMKAKMQSAADAAAVASISENSAGYIAATKMTSDGSVSVGVTDATNIFRGNVPAVGNGYTGDPLKTLPTVIKTGSNLTSVVTFTAKVPTRVHECRLILVSDHFRQFERELVLPLSISI
jgi:Flp pilus assembly protein TadG